MKRIVEQDIEDAALDILQNDLGYEYVYGPNISISPLFFKESSYFKHK